MDEDLVDDEWTEQTYFLGLGHQIEQARHRFDAAIILPDPSVLKQLKLFWLSVGNRDALYRAAQGDHPTRRRRTWPHWRLDTNAHETGAMSANF